MQKASATEEFGTIIYFTSRWVSDSRPFCSTIVLLCVLGGKMSSKESSMVMRLTPKFMDIFSLLESRFAMECGFCRSKANDLPSRNIFLRRELFVLSTFCRCPGNRKIKPDHPVFIFANDDFLRRCSTSEPVPAQFFFLVQTQGWLWLFQHKELDVDLLNILHSFCSYSGAEDFLKYFSVSWLYW